jgi:hypothetical protein
MDLHDGRPFLSSSTPSGAEVTDARSSTGFTSGYIPRPRWGRRRRFGGRRKKSLNGGRLTLAEANSWPHSTGERHHPGRDSRAVVLL